MGLLVRVELLQVHISPLGVLLLQVFVQGVLVAEDEVQLVVLAAFVRSEHDGVRCAVMELILKRRNGTIRTISEDMLTG